MKGKKKSGDPVNKQDCQLGSKKLCKVYINETHLQWFAGNKAAGIISGC